VTPMVVMVPARKKPIAEVINAGPPRPTLA
jgi:hypothetical protein